MTSVKSASERELKKKKLKTNSVQAYFPFSGAVNGLDMEGAPTDANPVFAFTTPSIICGLTATETNRGNGENRITVFA